MIANLNRSKSALIAGLLVSLAFSSQANAASVCKGLENSACDSTSSCSWVEGYTRKDGKAVKSFCRSKAKSKTTKSNKLAKKTVKTSTASK